MTSIFEALVGPALRHVLPMPQAWTTERFHIECSHSKQLLDRFGHKGIELRDPVHI